MKKPIKIILIVLALGTALALGLHIASNFPDLSAAIKNLHGKS